MVVVVGGVMSILGDDNTARKAKDHSRDASGFSGFGYGQKPRLLSGESSHAMESRMR